MVVSYLIERYKNLGCRMFLKLHLLHCHLNFFCESMEDAKKELVGHFHQGIQVMENNSKEGGVKL